VLRVKKNKDLFLNDRLDEILCTEVGQHGGALRRCSSMEVIKGTKHNELNETVSSITINSYADSYPILNFDEEGKLKDFHEYLEELRQAEIDGNNKGEQYSDPESDNVYASPREPEPEIQMFQAEV